MLKNERQPHIFILEYFNIIIVGVTGIYIFKKISSFSVGVTGVF